MNSNFSHADITRIMDHWRGTNGATVKAVMAAVECAIELLAARGGTMTVEELRDARMNAERWISSAATSHPHAALGEIVTHYTAQGAEVATLRETVAAMEKTADELQRQRDHFREAVEVLKEENTALRAELGRLKPSGCDCAAKNIACIHWAVRHAKSSGQVADLEQEVRDCLWEHDETCAAERGTGGCGKECARYAPTAALSRLAALAQEAQEAAMLKGQLLLVKGRADAAEWRAMGNCVRSTCAHEDASTPGHADRVKERSEAFSEAATMHPNGSCVCAGEGLCEWCTKVERAAVFNECAEAMRAACLEAVRGQLQVFAMAGGLFELAVKKAIEGAAP